MQINNNNNKYDNILTIYTKCSYQYRQNHLT